MDGRPYYSQIAASQPVRSWRAGGACYWEPKTPRASGSKPAPAIWHRRTLAGKASEHARDWVSLGAPPLARPAIQRMIADLQVDIESTRWMVYHAAWLSDSGKKTESRHAAAQVRLASGEMLKRSIDRATMIFTGPGPAPAIEPNLMVKNLVPFDAWKYRWKMPVWLSQPNYLSKPKPDLLLISTFWR